MEKLTALAQTTVNALQAELGTSSKSHWQHVTDGQIDSLLVKIMFENDESTSE